MEPRGAQLTSCVHVYIAIASRHQAFAGQAGFFNQQSKQCEQTKLFISANELSRGQHQENFIHVPIWDRKITTFVKSKTTFERKAPIQSSNAFHNVHKKSRFGLAHSDLDMAEFCVAELNSIKTDRHRNLEQTAAHTLYCVQSCTFFYCVWKTLMRVCGASTLIIWDIGNASCEFDIDGLTAPRSNDKRYHRAWLNNDCITRTSHKLSRDHFPVIYQAKSSNRRGKQ